MEHLSKLCSNDLLKDLLLSNMFITTCKRNKDLEEIRLAKVSEIKTLKENFRM